MLRVTERLSRVTGGIFEEQRQLFVHVVLRIGVQRLEPIVRLGGAYEVQILRTERRTGRRRRRILRRNKGGSAHSVAVVARRLHVIDHFLVAFVRQTEGVARRSKLLRVGQRVGGV